MQDRSMEATARNGKRHTHTHTQEHRRGGRERKIAGRDASGNHWEEEYVEVECGGKAQHGGHTHTHTQKEEEDTSTCVCVWRKERGSQGGVLERLAVQETDQRLHQELQGNRYEKSPTEGERETNATHKRAPSH